MVETRFNPNANGCKFRDGHLTSNMNNRIIHQSSHVSKTIGTLMTGLARYLVFAVNENSFYIWIRYVRISIRQMFDNVRLTRTPVTALGSRKSCLSKKNNPQKLVGISRRANGVQTDFSHSKETQTITVLLGVSNSDFRHFWFSINLLSLENRRSAITLTAVCIRIELCFYHCLFVF